MTTPPLRSLLLLCAATLGVSLATPVLAEKPVDVAVSVPAQADWVKRIGGAYVRTRIVVPEGVLPENFTLGPAAIEGIGKADLYLGVGHPQFRFEAIEVVPALERAGVPYLTLLEGAKRSDDPRPWTSPRRVMSWLPLILEALSEIDVEHAGAFAENTEKYLAEIAQLDKQFGRRLSARRQRTLVVTHPLWSGFCGDYGLDQLALTRDGKELGPRDLVPLVEGLNELGVKILIAHPGLSQRGAKILAPQIGGRIEEIDPDAVPWLDNVRRTGELFVEALRSS